MNRRIWIRIVQATVVVAVVVAVVLTVRYFFISDDDDRPPIIVKNGSMTLDDGDAADPSQHWKPWKKHNPSEPQSAHRWRPDHPNGKSVANFTATIDGSSGPGSCAAGTQFTGTEVDIEYTEDSTTTATTVKVERVTILSTPGQSKWEPLISAPADLSAMISAAPSPPQLKYDPGAGYISKVTVTPSSTSQTCAFKKPDNDTERQAVRIAIKPNK